MNCPNCETAVSEATEHMMANTATRTFWRCIAVDWRTRARAAESQLSHARTEIRMALEALAKMKGERDEARAAYERVSGHANGMELQLNASREAHVADLALLRRVERDRDSIEREHNETLSELQQILGGDHADGVDDLARRIIAERDAERQRASALAEQLAAVTAEAAAIKSAAMSFEELLSNLLSVVSESEGVIGYHLNGAVATWKELEIDALQKAHFEFMCALASDAGTSLLSCLRDAEGRAERYGKALTEIAQEKNDGVFAAILRDLARAALAPSPAPNTAKEGGER